MTRNTEVQRRVYCDLDVMSQLPTGELAPKVAASADSTAQARKPLQVSWREVELGSLLGDGGFSSVYLVNFHPKIKTKNEAAFVDGLSDMEESMFALKKLNDDALCNPEITGIATKDLVYEAKLLTEIRHDHIVSLHAISSTFWQKPEEGFLILERLNEALEERLSQWKCTRALMALVSYSSSAHSVSCLSKKSASLRPVSVLLAHWSSCITTRLSIVISSLKMPVLTVLGRSSFKTSAWHVHYKKMAMDDD